MGVLLCPHARAATFTVTPSAISNQYSGVITLQIGGLTNGETVVVQKYVDANSNGVVDSGDWLVQQFLVTDNQAPSVIGGVTNINIPYDSNPTNGAVTVLLSPFNEGIENELVGQSAFVLSSPTGRFTAVTNLFNVTNSPYAQSFTGQVTCNGTNVPNAIVLLASPGQNLHVWAGGVANSSGGFKLKIAPGTYKLYAAKKNFVFNGNAAPVVTLGSGATISTNLILIPATTFISGQFVDAANPAFGLPGILIGAFSTNAAFGNTDTNGNFTLPVISAQWNIGYDQVPLDLHGYLALNNNTNIDTSTGSVTGVTIALPKATALFYGTVKDSLNNPLPGVSLGGDNGNNNSGLYQGDGRTDQNGNYVVGVVAGNWSVNVSGGENSYHYGNYIFSQGPPWTYNNGGNGTNLTTGMAVQANFTAVLATNQITGNVKDSGNNPITGVQVFANATINGISYNTQTTTDGSGNYSLNVANGGWSVEVSCNGGSESLDNILGPGNYQCPANQNVNISNNNGSANFTVQLCSGVQINTTNLPNGQVGVFYDQFLQASSCTGNVLWNLNDPQNFPSSLTLDSNGQIHGTPTATGTYNFSVHADDGNGHTANQNLALNITSGSRPSLGSPTWLANGRFQLNINGSAGQNYTVQYSLTLTNWTTLFVTNSPSGLFTITDSNATNASRYYRVLIGP